MRYRSSALALAACLAASFAHAEDAVAPGEFDRPGAVDGCDAYGAGFARIPGTDTCARVSGKVRLEQGFSKSSNRGGRQVQLDFETRGD